eukprot:superscaffoldBa00006884_g21990
MEENQNPELRIKNPVKREESGSPSATTDKQSISQRGDLLAFTNQDDYKSRTEENQNPEHWTDNPVKREESGSPSATTDKQHMCSPCGLHTGTLLATRKV